MRDMTYTKLINETLQIYLKDEYLEAYNYITENAPKVEGNEAQIFNFRYAIACKAGLTDLSLEIMKEAVVDKGYWYSYEYLMEDDDLEPLYKKDQFIELANICKTRELETLKDSKPDLKVIMTNDSDQEQKRQLIIALHGNQENIFITEKNWSSCLKDSNMLALPQSSQIEFSDAYNWEDIAKGADELKNHYDKLLKEYNVDSESIILGGFSAGARVSLNTVLNDLIQVKGLIFVGPWLPEIDEWENLLELLRIKGIKSYVICGDQDEDCLEGAMKFIDMLNNKGLPNKFKLIKNLDHDYPDNFNDLLEEAFKFINM
ncbi:alpha/beta hydrolase [Vallitalea okinawensis]|uniref:alpha/beta hydrolase n=1 Tax=Vallitalea okinawensis TaxID=2078660 RepID=UPI001A9A6CBD|nr:hypothetical protein [Vallitalea okinawensis]